jgi:dGTPase
MTQKKESPQLALKPMTLEGCVVRMADTVAYVGRDLEDAIRLKVIRRSDLPADVVKVLGDTNGTIVYNLVTDIIRNSHEKPYVAFSDEVSRGLKRLKDFNLERIYLNPMIKQYSDSIRCLFDYLFNKYLDDLEKQNRSSKIFTSFLQDISQDYIQRHQPAEIVRDFIAGMTDRYFLEQCPEKMRPKVQQT